MFSSWASATGLIPQRRSDLGAESSRADRTPVHYREATYGDALAIATLHADSWRATYRGAYRDEFLDNDVGQDRIDVWEKRMSGPTPNQFVVIAEEARQLVGFACAYGREDESWGTLLDNLHVRREHQRHGTGTGLLLEVAAWCRAHYADCGVYLWVLAENGQARRFYERLGARDCGGSAFVPPGGGEINSRRYAWANVDEILHGQSE
jgi:GNAT superfamily N-acetyltransferase